MIYRMILLVFLSICAYTDLKGKRIYNGVVCFFLLLSVAARLFGTGKSGPDLFNEAMWMAGGMAVGLFSLLLSSATREQIGRGDGLVLLCTGCLLGFKGNMLLFMRALLLAAAAAALLLALGKAGKKTAFPFLPFLLASSFWVQEI